jgi:hypothetical protein
MPGQFAGQADRLETVLDNGSQDGHELLVAAWLAQQPVLHLQ